MRAIVLVTDAYGGRGGIALYNRNLLKAEVLLFRADRHKED